MGTRIKPQDDRSRRAESAPIAGVRRGTAPGLSSIPGLARSPEGLSHAVPSAGAGPNRAEQAAAEARADFPRAAFIHGRPSAHWFHQVLADSIGATPVPVDFRLRWNDVEGASSFRRYSSWLICSLLFPRRRSYSLFLSEGPHILPALMRWMGILRRDQRIVALMANETLYFVQTRRYPAATCRWMRRVIASYDALVCVGEMQTRLAHELLAGAGRRPRVTTVSSAISPGRWRDLPRVSPALDQPSLLFIGNMSHLWRSWYKGVDILLEAVRSLAPRVEGLRLRIAGTAAGECVREMEERAGPRPVWLEWAGALGDLAPVFGRSSLYVHPGRGEAFGITVLEAMRAGVPAMVSEWTGAREAVERVDPRLVVPLDASLLAARIHWYLELDLREKEEISRRSREVAGEYTQDRALRQFAATIREIGAGGARAR